MFGDAKILELNASIYKLKIISYSAYSTCDKNRLHLISRAILLIQIEFNPSMDR